MKEPHTEGVATHGGPESCVVVREGDGEALTGVRTGTVLSRENRQLQSADAVIRSGRHHRRRRYREVSSGSARSETRCTYGTSLHENREIPRPLDQDGGRAASERSKAASR
jgi:hypothetical protein